MNLQVVIILVVNSQGQWLAHQRSSAKSIYPNLWGLGAGGKVDAGETPLQAAQRELREELQISGTHLTSYGEFTWQSPETSYQGHLFGCETKVKQPPLNTEFAQLAWLSSAQIAALMAQGQFCPDTTWIWENFKVDSKH